MRAVLLAALAYGALLGGTAHAERYVRSGEVEIHYNALHADAVDADAARAHGIARSAHRGLVTVTVVTPGGVAPRAVEAVVSGAVSNLAGQRQALAFRAVREREAIYYLAEFPIACEDVYRFELAVTPGGASRAETIRFEQPLVAGR